MGDTIFVSVASYRDDECPTTLQYLFGNAERPENIFVGICQQNDMSEDSKDIECILPEEKYKNNIKMMRLKHYEAKGPTWARYLCSTLYDNQTYFFQIDSHTKLVPGWDKKCINMMKKLKESGMSQKPVLSHYPAAWEPESQVGIPKVNGVTRICKSFFNDSGMISFLGAETIETDEMHPSPYVAGGFLFCEGSLLKDVPFDPTLDYLFVGEEILHSIRIWTAGYDIFTPNENIAFHEYTRENKPKIWTDKNYTDAEAFRKVKELIGLSKNNPNLHGYKYGLGNVRSLEDYYHFAGIDLEKKKVNKNFCRQGLIDDAVDIEQKPVTESEVKDPDSVRAWTSQEHFTNSNAEKSDNVTGSGSIIIIIVIIVIIAYLIYTLS